MSRTAEDKRHIDDRKWLESVRSDLDSKPEEWVVPVHSGATNKLQALGSYLDTILNELGVPSPPHKCPRCGALHQSEDVTHAPGAS